nr:MULTISPECIES: MBL fold metallo-hydrolase [Paenibacillus]
MYPALPDHPTSIETAVIDRTVSSGEKLPWCDGIEIIHTPGHLPGHISLYLPSSKTLIAGDALVIEDGKHNIANPQHTLDLEEAITSVEKLLEYDIKQLICYHGGCFREIFRRHCSISFIDIKLNNQNEQKVVQKTASLFSAQLFLGLIEQSQTYSMTKIIWLYSFKA